MNRIKLKVDSLCKKYNTRDPYELASHLNIEVIEWELHPDINGCYQYVKRNKQIFINNTITDEEQRIVCAHELGHAVLHEHSSIPFMRNNTLFSVEKIEREANTFAAELLIPDDALYCCEQPTIYDISARYEVPEALVKLKFK